MEDQQQRKIQALVSMIDDPDDAVYKDISDQIIQYGDHSLPFLEDALMQAVDGTLFTRIESLIHIIRYRVLTDELVSWFKDDENNLLAAWLLLASYHHPDLNPDIVHQEIDAIRQDIWLEMNENLTALEQIRVFNHVFYELHHFRGDMDNYHEADNSHIHSVLKRRTGNPLSLGILYMEIAKSLDLPIAGINLPEHFVLAYVGETIDTESLQIKKNVPLFYINAFSGGAVFSAKEINDFLIRLKMEPAGEFFKPCTNREVLLRMLNNLVMAYNLSGQAGKKAEMESLRDQLEKTFMP